MSLENPTVVEMAEPSNTAQVRHGSAEAHIEVGDDPALGEIVRRLVNAYRPERIYLFGSRARGNLALDSDYDLFVVVPDDAPAERRRSRLAYETLRGTGIAADVLVWTHEAFESRIPLRASLPATVIAEGKLVYAA